MSEPTQAVGAPLERRVRPLLERLRAFVELDGGDIADVEEAADAIERMQAWLEGDCNCPCCSESRACSDGCTFASDCPEAAERMAGAREALFGPNVGVEPVTPATEE